MFRCPSFNPDTTPQYIYLHRLENLYDNRPILLAKDLSIPLQRRVFLLKRWRDERIVYLYVSFRDTDVTLDTTLKKLNLLIAALKKAKHPKQFLKFPPKRNWN